ncbi:hypothetical protein ABTN34_17985, partial [Acinetobacter baumannii]
MVAPAATVAVAGTVAAALFEPRLIVKPPAGAAELIVTVAVDGLPPVTVVGLSDRPVTVGAVAVTLPVLLEPLADAVIVAVVSV